MSLAVGNGLAMEMKAQRKGRHRLMSIPLNCDEFFDEMWIRR